MKRLGSFFIIIVLMTCSCSVLRIALRYADWMIMREATKVFDLDDTQKAKLKSATTSELAWLKQAWVNEAIAFGEAVEERVADGLDEADQRWIDQESIRLRVKLAEHVLPALAPIAVTITPAQLTHAKQEFEKKNEKLNAQLALSDERLIAKRADKVEDGIEDWYGRLSDDQEATLCKIFDCSRKELERLVNTTNAFQDALLDLIANEHDPKKWTEKTIAWAAHPETVLNDSRRVTWLEFRKEQPLRLAKVDALMTKKQRDHAREKLRGLIEDLKWFREH